MRDVITIPEVAIQMGDFIDSLTRMGSKELVEFIMVLDEDMGEFDSTEKLALAVLSRLRDAHSADVQHYTEGCLHVTFGEGGVSDQTIDHLTLGMKESSDAVDKLDKMIGLLKSIVG